MSPLTLEHLNSLPEIKQFTVRGNSGHVALLQGGQIVRKIYRSNLPVQRESFEREIAIYRYFERLNYQYVPQLLGADHDKCTLYVSFCGRTPVNNEHYNRLARARVKDLYQKTGLYYSKNGQKRWLLFWENMCVMNENMYVIDFGARRWQLEVRPNTKDLPETKQLQKALKKRQGNLYASRREALKLLAKERSKRS